MSNLPFLLVGIVGLRALREDDLPGIVRSLYPAYATFFGAAMLIAVGSAYYHLNPENSTLTWDRLPMTLGFMAFVAIILGEHVSADIARRSLLPLLLLGVLSVLYWSFTESEGHGDLRPYFAVQFLPILLIPLVLLFIPSVLSNAFYIWTVVASYAGAKVLEVLDEPIYRTSRAISGHTLKHILAAFGMYFVVLAMRHRHRVTPEANSNAAFAIVDHGAV